MALQQARVHDACNHMLIPSMESISALGAEADRHNLEIPTLD